MKGISGVLSTTEFFRAMLYHLVYIEKTVLLPKPGKNFHPDDILQSFFNDEILNEIFHRSYR